MLLLQFLQVITSISIDKFDGWKKDDFEPEECYIEMLEVINGISDIETRTYKVCNQSQFSFIRVHTYTSNKLFY